MNALLVGRFHAVTRAQEAWLKRLRADRIICALTSANHSGTRRNPLSVEQREAIVRPALEATGIPFTIVRIDDVPETKAWAQLVVSSITPRPTPADTQVFSSNHDVRALFEEAGFTVVGDAMQGLTPHELVQRIADGRPWEEEASKATRAAYGSAAKVRAIFSQRLLNDDGELGHARDFASYGAQMDASLKLKLDDVLPWVKPGCIVDKGCGTGKLMVELSKRFSQSAFVGVDLSRELLRVSDENTYASQDVELIFGNAIDRCVPQGSATTVILSSIAHEIYSYTGYALASLDKALANIAWELESGGRFIMRDGISPGEATWRMRFLDDATLQTFERFAEEFKHGHGAPHEKLGPNEVRLSAHLVNEFLCKKDYLKNWHIEVHEEYGALTLLGWHEALLRAGLTPVEVRGYVNPWIADNRYQGHVALTDDAGKKLPWPFTNVVAVAVRP